MLGCERVEPVLGPVARRFLEAREDVRRHTGPGARADDVRRDAVLRERQCRRGGEPDDSAFRGRVVGLSRGAREKRLRGGVHDPPVHRRVRRLGPGPPVRGREVGGVEVALQMDPDHRVPLVLGHREDHPVAQDARVVDEDVQLPELGDRQLDQFPGLLVVGHVSGVRDGTTARRPDPGGDLLGGRGGRGAGAVPAGLSEVVHDDGGAEPGKLQRLRPAQAAARARDDRGPALKWQ